MTTIPDPPLDYFGREIKPGDRVVYTTTARSAVINEGVVTHILHKPVDMRDYKTNTTYTVLVTHIKVKVNGTKWDKVERKYVPCVRTKTLDDPSRFIVVNDLQDFRE